MVVDIVVLIVVCQDVVLLLDEDGVVEFVIVQVDVGFLDNCIFLFVLGGIVELSFDINVFGCGDVGM